MSVDRRVRRLLEEDPLKPEVLSDAAHTLTDAYRTGRTVRSVIDDDKNLTLSHAYEIQREQVRHRVADGDRLRGFKVGLASVPAQREFDVREPVLGRLTGGMFHAGQLSLDAARLHQPRIEPALAFVLGGALRGPGSTVADAARAVEFVLPALEITDSRVEEGARSAPELVADNAGCGGVVLGTTPVALAGTDLRLAGFVLYLNGAVAATGAGGMALGSPLNAVVWAANALGAEGSALEAGQLVLVSSVTPSVPVGAGDTVSATVAGVGAVTAAVER